MIHETIMVAIFAVVFLGIYWLDNKQEKKEAMDIALRSENALKQELEAFKRELEELRKRQDDSRDSISSIRMGMGFKAKIGDKAHG